MRGRARLSPRMHVKSEVLQSPVAFARAALNWRLSSAQVCEYFYHCAACEFDVCPECAEHIAVVSAEPEAEPAMGAAGPA